MRAPDAEESARFTDMFLASAFISSDNVPPSAPARVTQAVGFLLHDEKGVVRKQNLYIIGNGFDLHHGIKSRFSDFKRYLQDVDRALYKLVDEYIPADENWSDLELALADVDPDEIKNYARQFLKSYSADPWSDSYHHDYQYEINRIVEGLSVKLKKRFTEWVSKIYIPRPVEVEGQRLNLNRDAKYLSFNYTPTLSMIYGISKDNILYIHGEVGNSDREIVLGHAWKPTFKPIPNLPDPDEDPDDPRTIEGNEITNKYFENTFKNVQSIINENQSFFASLHQVGNIYVLGHSLSAVDIDYFKEILKKINTDKVCWRISFFGEKELDKHRATINKLGISGNNVSFCELQRF